MAPKNPPDIHRNPDPIRFGYVSTDFYKMTGGGGNVDTQKILARIDHLLKEYNDMRAQSEYDDLSGLDAEGRTDKFTTQAMATIEAVSPPNSAYLNESRYRTKEGDYQSKNIPTLVGILQALRDDYNSGYLWTLKELIHAEVFSDFLDMADYILSEGYKDPAAVLTGGVLEEHLRKLCIKDGIDPQITQNGKLTHKKASIMNDELMKSNIYNNLQHKLIIAWLDLRNNAAHGKYSTYDDQQVSMMLQGVTSFIANYPG